METDELIWLSKSKINTLDWCQAQFYWQYIEEKRAETQPQIFGRLVHNFHELLYKNLQISPTEAIKTSLQTIGELDEKIRPDIENIITLTLNRFELCTKKFGKKWRDYFFPKLNEVKINLPKLGLNGIVDDVFLNDDNEYVVFELKSQSQKLMNDSKRRREMAFYKILLDNSGLLDKPVRYGVMYFSSINQFVIEEISTRSVNAVWKRIEKARAIIRNCEYKCEPVRWLGKGLMASKCDTCAYFDICPKDPRAVLKDENKKYLKTLVYRYRRR